jgi:hypothetical protein
MTKTQSFHFPQNMTKQKIEIITKKNKKYEKKGVEKKRDHKIEESEKKRKKKR